MLLQRISNSRAGFTLIELVIAFGILGILTKLVIMNTKWMRDRAMGAVFYSDIRQVKIAAGRFQIDMGFFPPDVDRGIDPSLITRYGYKAGGHSAKWEGYLDNPSQKKFLLRDMWNGPYLNAKDWRTWKRNPWGGLYDWDNYEPGYNYMGITGGAVYLTLKPATWGGKDGLPPVTFERQLQEQGIDSSNWDYCVAVKMGSYQNSELGGGH